MRWRLEALNDIIDPSVVRSRNRKQVGFHHDVELDMTGPVAGDAISWLDVGARTNINRLDAAATTAYKRPGHNPWYTSRVQLEVR